MPDITLRTAAKLARDSYHPGQITGHTVIASLDEEDVQAYLLEGDILLLPGSNSVRDYLRYNLRPLRLGQRRLTMNSPATEKGASGTIWHQGFLAYSQVVFDWLGQKGVHPTYIIGHSLGAAATQILSKSYNAAAVGFAAPRPKWARGRVKNDHRCLLINRYDDIVPKLPGEFSHMGSAKLLKPMQRRYFPAHHMKHYIDIVQEALQQQKLPASWDGGQQHR